MSKTLTEPSCIHFDIDIWVLSHSTPIVQVVVPAMFNFYFLEQQIQTLKEQGSYLGNLVLNRKSKQELLWWVENMDAIGYPF